MDDAPDVSGIEGLGPAQWSGMFPVVGRDVGRTPVVYALYDADERCAYVGSSTWLRERLRLHTRDKDASSWWAWQDVGPLTSSRRYEREAAVIERLEPYLNRWDMRSPVCARRAPGHLQRRTS